jgi:hypothetical protein
VILSGPIYEASSANTDGLWTAGALVGASAAFVIFRAENFVYFADNGAWAARLYYYAAPPAAGHGALPGGGTQAGSQQGPFINTVPVDVSWDASLVPPGQYAIGFVLPSTTMKQGMVLSLYDDVGGFPGGLSYAGGIYHDPMLDEILAAVKRTYTNS